MGGMQDQLRWIVLSCLVTHICAIIQMKDVHKRSFASNFTCPSREGLFKNPSDCKSFYNCKDDRPFLQNCQLNLVFNPRKMACDYPDNVPGCGSDGSPVEFVCPQLNGFFPNLDNCLAYYMCREGHFLKMDCPLNLVFNPELNKCDYPDNAPECMIEIKDVSEMNASFTCPSQSGLFRDPLDCTSFYHCWLGKPTKQRCSPGFAFDDAMGYCVLYYQSTSCRGNYAASKLTSPPYTSISLMPDSFRCPEQNAVISHPTKCDTFYHCINYVAYIQYCPSPLAFNARLKSCDYAFNVPGCQASRGSPYLYVSEFICPRQNGEFRNAQDCGTFYYCFDGRVILQHCPVGLYFNEKSATCDWPTNVPECSGSFLPHPNLPPQPDSIYNGKFEYNCQNEGLFSNPDDCGAFYNCGPRGATLEFCPSTLVFNQVKQRCDYPENVPGCSGFNLLSVGSGHVPAVYCQVSNQVSENPNDCSSYYRCDNGQLKQERCEAGFVYNPRSGVCDWLYKSPHCCQGCNIPQPSPAPPAPPIIIPVCGKCRCPEPYGEFPNPNDCRSFYHCSHNIAYVKPCPSNLVFNPRLKVCDWPGNVPGCGTDPLPSPPDWRCTTADRKFRNTGDCSTYFECKNFQPTLVRCQPGFYFSENKQACDFQQNVKECYVTPAPPGPTSNPLPGSRYCKRPTGQFRNPNNCNSFYNCWENTAWEQFCPDGLVFNERLSWCDYPSQVPECGGGRKPDIQPGYRCPSPIGIFIHQTDCTIYYSCVNNIPELVRCGPGLAVNPITLMCDWANNVKGCIGEKVIDFPNRNVVKRLVSPVEFRCPQPSGLYAKPNDCSRFYSCGNGYNAWDMPCPSGLVFNEPLQICDWPFNVPTCGGPGPKPEPGPICTIDKLYRNKEDCTRYFSCNNGGQVEHHCQPGLFFNEKAQYCDYPSNVPECKSPGTVCPCNPDPPTPPPLPTCDPECTFANGNFQAEKPCIGYYHCQNCKKVYQECGKGLAFHPQRQCCDDIKNVPGCGPPPVPPNCNCPYPAGKFPLPDDCTGFISCENWQPTIIRCPVGLVFNKFAKSCDHPINSPGCGLIDPTVSPTETPGPPCPPIPGICQYQSGLFKHPRDCHSFYFCLNWIAFELTCPGGTAFNPVKKICDWAWDIPGCSVPTPVVPTNPYPVVCHGDGNLPVEGDCTAYWMCCNNVPTFTRCSPGMAFSSFSKRCELWVNSNCNVCPVCPVTPTTTQITTPRTPPTTQPPTTQPPTTPRTPPTTPRTLPPTPRTPPTTASTALTTLPTKDPCCLLACGHFKYNCTHYYNCWDGIANLVACPKGLVFNSRTSQCDLPENVRGCEPTTPTVPVPGFKCSHEFGLFPHPQDCSSYYICCNYKEYLRKCPSSLYFNPQTRGCDFHWNCKCPVPPPDPNPPPQPTCRPSPPEEFKCPKANGYFRDPRNCNTYYVCCNWYPFKASCPGGTAYNEAKQICDWGNEVPGCQIATTPVVPVNFICPHDGNFPSASDCTTYWYCVNKKPVFQRCNPGQGFNPGSRQCDWLNNIPYCNCPVCPFPGPLPVCDEKCPTPYGLSKGPTCGSYYNCAACHAYLQYCPEGLAFNPAKSYCDWPGTVPGCGHIKPPGPKPYVCPYPNGIYPHSWDCKKYYLCYNDVSALVTCPKGLEFSNSLRMCVFPWSVPKCGGDVINNNVVPDPGFRCPEGNGVFPAPNVCRNYYQCCNGNAFLMCCPADTAFNQATKICDWVWNVNTPGCTGLDLPTLNPTTFFCPHDGNWPVPGDCSAFWDCKGMKPKFKRCIPGMVYNKDSRECDFWKNVKGGCVCPICPAVLPDVRPSDPNCPTAFGHFPGQVCGTYYNCYEGKGHLQHCPRGLVFNPDRNYCDYACRVPGCQHVTMPPDPVYPCTSNGFYPHPHDCSSYFCCQNGHSTVVKCPLGLVFNPATQGCDYVWCVKECGGIGPTVPPPPPQPCVTVPPHIFVCPIKDGNFKDSRSCNNYFRCIGGNAYETKCPDKLAYNEHAAICDWPQNVKGCGGPIVPDPPSNYVCPHDGNFRVAGDCIAYWECINNKARLKRCCPGMAFNPSSHQCDWWVNVHDCYYPTCSICPVGPVIDDTSLAPGSGYRCPRPTGQFCNPNDCTTFYNCWLGSWYLQKCPEGLAFNSDKMWCDWPENVPACRNITPVAVPDPAPWICPSFWGVYPDPYNCNTFYACTETGPVLKYCPYGQVFNPRKLCCDSQLNVPECCEPKPPVTIVPTPPVIPTPLPCDFKCPNPDGKFKHETSCRHFYWCSYGVPSLHSCPGDSLFNSKIGECDNPCNVPECQPHCPDPKPHPKECHVEGISVNDCRSYKLCCDGKLSIHYCSPTLFFNPQTLQCDFPYNVPHCCPNPITTTTAAIVHTCDPRCVGQPEGKHWAISYNCRDYWYCLNCCVVTETCNAGTSWSNQIKHCDYSSKDDQCNSITTTSTTVAACDPQCYGKPNGKEYAVCDNCIDYWYCVNCYVERGSCPLGTSWNKQHNRCDSIEKDRNCYPLTTPVPTCDPRCYGQPEGVENALSSDCINYWYCINCCVVPGRCFDGTSWNSLTKRCDTSSKDPNCNPVTTTPQPTCDPRCRVQPDGKQYAICYNCKDYWYCRNCLVVTETCPGSSTWNNEHRMCDNTEKDRNCNPITTTTTPKPTCDPRCPPGRPEGIHFAVCYDCRTYQYCLNCLLKTVTCDPGTSWNNRDKSCDSLPKDQYCDPITTTTPTTTIVVPFVCPYVGGISEDYQNCNMYYQCICGEVRHERCADDLVYNPERKLCDWSGSLNVNHKCYKKPDPLNCRCVGLDSYYYFFTKDCTTFALCLNGKAYIRRCSPGLFFNRRTGYCDLPFNVPECCACIPPPNLVESAQRSNVPVVFGKGQCSLEMGNEGVGSCNEYNLCLNYQPISQRCPNSLVFNKVIRSCDWPEYVPSCNVIVSYSAARPRVHYFPCPKANGLFSDPDSCMTFYHCLNNSPTLRHCPPGLQFNRNMQICDWPVNVNCKILLKK